MLPGQYGKISHALGASDTSSDSKKFLRVFLKKYKLYNLIKREVYILTTTTIKKRTNT